MKLISNSKVKWPESLIGQIDPNYLVPITDVKLCSAVLACQSMYKPKCGGILVATPKIRFGFVCNIIAE